MRDSVRVQRDLFSATIPRAAAPSGARYSGGGVTFRSGGTGALLETPTDTLRGCRGVRAATPWDASRLLGYGFRAIGQEPGWMVEIEAGRRMHVLADYGAIEFFTAPPAKSAAEGVVSYRAEAPDGGEVRVEIRRSRCEDVMSGERFPLSVRLVLNGIDYEGCGRWLE